MEERQEINVEESGNQISLQSILLAVRQNWLLILVITLVVTIAGAVYGAFFVKTQYTASATVMVDTKSDTSGETSYAISLTHTAAQLIATHPDIRSTAYKRYQDAHPEDTESPYGTITAAEVTQTYIIRITFTSTNKNANEILKEILTSIQDEINYVEGYEKDENGNDVPVYRYTSLAGKIKTIVRPTVSSPDWTSRIMRYLLIFFVIGLAISVVVVILKIIFDDTYKSKEDLERDIPLEVRAMIEDITDVKEEK